MLLVKQRLALVRRSTTLLVPPPTLHPRQPRNARRNPNSLRKRSGKNDRFDHLDADQEATADSSTGSTLNPNRFSHRIPAST